MGYKILSKIELCPNQYELTIEAPYIVRNAQAGQFIIFRAEENGERVPLTIADVNKEIGALTIVFMAVGYSTKKLAELNVGDELIDIVGPLGQPTHIKKYGTVVCLAGGYGAAPCYLIAKAFKEAGNKVYMIMGARTKELIFWQDKMKDACSELFIPQGSALFRSCCPLGYRQQYWKKSDRSTSAPHHSCPEERPGL